MIKYILKRLLMMIPVMLGVLTIVFFLNYITPGDPAKEMAGTGATEEQIDEIREGLGLNDPAIVQYGRYVFNLATKGDLGTSYSTKQPVMEEILDRYPTTIKLAFLSVALALVIGIPLGVISAVRQYSWIDNIAMVLALAGVSMPNFWLGMLLILLFNVKLHILPGSGISTPSAWILPVVTIGIISAASIARVTRSSMLEVIRSDYIRTAKAKGQSEWNITIHHALRNALIPIITIVGVQMGIQLGGAVMVETVFAIPGLGKYMVDAIKARNYPAVQGGVVFLSLIFSFVNLAVDLVYTVADPKLKARFFSQGKKQR